MTINDLYRRVKTQVNQQKPFVLYSSFNDDSCHAFFQSDKKSHIVSDFSESGFIFAPFDLNRPTYIIPNLKSELINFTPRFIKKSPSLFQEIQNDPKVHVKLVKQALDAINSTDLHKIVLARKAEFEFQDIDVIALFLSMFTAYPEAYSYCWYHPKTGFWLGASPETLLNLNQNKVETVALAGTQRYNGSLEIIWDDKNREEQKFVTDFLEETLLDQLDQLCISEPKTVRAGHLVHLKSVLTGTLKQSDNNLERLIKSIHPTPAVCGLPKAKAQHFILQNETIDRSFYSGFLGQINSSNDNSTKGSNLVVNLRCMHVDETKVTLFAGGGITSKSNPEKEWQETEAKIRTLKTIF